MRACPYEYEDASGGVIQVCSEGLVAELRTRRGRVATLPEPEFPEFIAALYAAAGKPEPVILERPEVPRGGCSNTAGIRVGLAEGRRVQVETSRLGDDITPAEALELAAHLVAYASLARSEPDPAEVEELAAEIRRELHPDSGRPGEADRTSARTALRWMAGKQQRREARGA